MATIDSAKLLEFLRKKRLDRLGHGIFSQVYAHPKSDRVVKVCNRDDGRDSWPDYVIWATKNGYAGTFAPKVYSLHFISGGYVATMERLISIKENDGVSAQCRQTWRRYNDAATDERREKIPMPAHFTDLHAFVWALADTFGGLDLHNGNVMCRNDGSLVITDPITRSDYEEPSLSKRMRSFDIAWTRNAKFQSEKTYAR